jgi:hypothetical protein
LKQQRSAIGAPDLDPRGILLRHDLLRRRPPERAVWREIDCGSHPLEVAPDLLVEGLGGGSADDGRHRGRVNREHDHHRGDEPQRETDADAV